MKMRGKNSEEGIALITAVLAVAVLLAIALPFAFNMRLEEKAAVNYMSSLQARYVAEAGIQYTVAKLKNDADPNGTPLLSYTTTEYDQLGDAWNLSLQPTPTGSVNLGKGITGTYTVTVVDAARRIYLNDFNNANLGTALENLVKVLRDAGEPLETGDGTSTYSNRPASGAGGYITKKQIMAVNGSTIDATEYATLKNYVTSEGYFDPNRFGGRSAININTADQYVLQAIFEAINSTDRDTIVQAIMEYRSGKKYNTSTVPWTKTTNDIGAGNPNPFDGVDTNRGDDNGTPSDGVDIDPIVPGFTGDGLNNDGDYNAGGNAIIDEADEAYMFAGGARGEFDALIDYITTYTYGNGSGTITSGAAVKNNADPAQTPATVGLDFESKFFEITSTGAITQGDEQLAESKIVRIVDREK